MENFHATHQVLPVFLYRLMDHFRIGPQKIAGRKGIHHLAGEKVDTLADFIWDAFDLIQHFLYQLTEMQIRLGQEIVIGFLPKCILETAITRLRFHERLNILVHTAQHDILVNLHLTDPPFALHLDQACRIFG